MAMKAAVPQERKVSVRQFLKFIFIYKRNIFEKFQKPIFTYFDSETYRVEVKVKC